MFTILLVIHTILVVFMILMILIQRSDSDGLGGLGGGGNQFLSGRSTANLLTRTTAILAGAFFFTSLVLAVMASNMSGRSIVDMDIEAPKADVAPASEKAKSMKSKTVEKTAPAEEKQSDTPSVPKPE